VVLDPIPISHKVSLTQPVSPGIPNRFFRVRAN
jgi:hypothetical protein